MRGVKRDLFDFGEVVGRVLVQRELADFAEREFGVWPDVCEIEDVDLLCFPEVFGLLCCHGLDLERPLGEIAFLDCLVEVFLGVVWGLGGGVFLCDELGALLGFHMELAVYPLALLVDEFDGVAEVAVHESIAVWNTGVAHQDHDLVDGLWVLGKVVPEHS